MTDCLPTRSSFGNKRLVRSHRIVFKIRTFFRRESSGTTQHLSVPAAGQGLCGVADLFIELLEVEFGGDHADGSSHCQLLWLWLWVGVGVGEMEILGVLFSS